MVRRIAFGMTRPGWATSSAVSARLEAVVLVEADDRGREERRQVGAVALGSVGVEDDADAVVTVGGQQVDADDERADELAGETDDGRRRQRLGADVVDEDGDDDEHGGAQHGGVHGGFEAEEDGDVGAGAVRDGGDGHQQRPHVHPAGHPRPALAPQPPGPGVDAAGDRVLGDDLAEDQRDEELAAAGQHERPDHRRSAVDDRDAEEGVGAHHR
jgi:hypothetical protein